jgi:hypothetical protein
MKIDLEKLKKNAGEIKDKATQAGADALKTAQTIKKGISTGAQTTKNVVEKASQVLTKENLSQGAELSSKGAGMAAKGAKLASQGADFLSKAMEKASSGLKSLSDKLKK